MDISARPFHLPQGLSLEQQVVFSLQVISKYRQEVLPLRQKATVCQTHHDPLLEQLKEWREKYHKAQEEIGKLRKENDKLKKEIEKLTKTNNRYQVALFDHGNFKNPNDINKKEKGGQLGHPDTNREKAEDYSSYRRQRLFVKVCGKCHTPLSRVDSTKQKILLDIVLNPNIVRLILESERQWCGKCQKEVNARDTRTLPFTEYGINTFMMTMILRFKCHASLENIATVMTISHGLKLSKSDVSNLLTQGKLYLKSRYDKLIETIRKGSVMYNDETGWQVHGESAWMWIMANEKVTIYFAAESRGKGIAEELYGESLAKSMHDGLASYTNAIPHDKHLLCWAHFLRFVHEETVLEKEGSEAILLKDELVRIYHIKGDNPEYSLQQLENVLRYELDKVLKVNSTNQSIIAIKQRLKVQREGLINSLLYTKDGTNNLAERELRPMVINKKISNGSDTFKGMETTAIVGSVMQTISKKEEDVILNLKLYLREGIQEKYKQYSNTAFYDSS